MAGPRFGGAGLVPEAWAVRRRACACFIYVYSSRNGMLRAGDAMFSLPGFSPQADRGTRFLSSSVVRHTSQYPHLWSPVLTWATHRDASFLHPEKFSDLCQV